MLHFVPSGLVYYVIISRFVICRVGQLFRVGMGIGKNGNRLWELNGNGKSHNTGNGNEKGWELIENGREWKRESYSMQVISLITRRH